MQNNTVKAFRQRLLRAGFRDVSIYDYCDGTYRLYCVDSSGKNIRATLTEERMCALPFVVWKFD